MAVVINGTTGITSVNGSASAPSVTGTDTDTGIVYGTNTLSLATGGTTAVTVDSSQNVGIGTSSPTSKLDVLGTASVSEASSAANAGGQLNFNARNDSASIQPVGYIKGALSNGAPASYSGGIVFGTAVNNTYGERMRIDSSGNVGIGTSSPSKKLEVGSLGAFRLQTGSVTMDCTPTPGGIDGFVWNVSAGYYDWSIGGSSKMRIDSSGNFYLAGTTQIGSGLFSMSPASGSAGIGMRGVGGSGAYVYFTDTHVNAVPSRIGHVTNINQFAVQVNGSGGVYMGSGATSWSSLSDERLKDIIEPITDATSKVCTLRAVIGKYKTDAEGTRRSFLIAQDIKAVLPEAVSDTNIEIGSDDTYLGVQYTDVIPLLVAAIKEQQAIIEQLRADVAQLKGQA